MHNILTNEHRFAKHRFLYSDLFKKKNCVIINVIIVSGMAENRTYYVIVAQFHSEIKYPFSVTLTLKPPHMIILISF